jgi:hypothetical protein
MHWSLILNGNGLNGQLWPLILNWLHILSWTKQKYWVRIRIASVSYLCDEFHDAAGVFGGGMRRAASDGATL